MRYVVRRDSKLKIMLNCKCVLCVHRFDKREEAQEAIAALNNVIPEGGTEPLSVKVCAASIG